MLFWGPTGRMLWYCACDAGSDDAVKKLRTHKFIEARWSSEPFGKSDLENLAGHPGRTAVRVSHE